MGSWTAEQLRHIARFAAARRVDAPTVYDSLGRADLAAPEPGFLDLGLWSSPRGTEAEAPAAARALVAALAEELPRQGVVVDVANGLGA